MKQPPHHYRDEEPPEPDTETINRAMKKKRQKSVLWLIGVLAAGGLGYCTSFVRGAVDISRTPDQIRQLQQDLITERDTRQKNEYGLSSDLATLSAECRANNQSTKESLDRIESALHIVSSPKQKDLSREYQQP